MLAFVYRSPKKDEMYLYLTKRDDFSNVPKELLQAFGEPVFSLQLNLANRTKLARESIELVKEQLEEKGFFLQMPPKIESLLLENQE